MGYYVIVFVIGNTIPKAVITVMIGNYIHRVIVIEGSLLKLRAWEGNLGMRLV